MKSSRQVLRQVATWLALAAWTAVAAAQTLDITNAPARRRSVSLEGTGESERPLPLWLLERAYLRAPDDMNRVHGFIRGQVLARTNLTSPVTPRPLPKSIPSHLPLTICQMASFRSNGDLFDGRGVAPDVIVEAKPTDHLADGTDTVLAAALERLNPIAQQRN